MFSSLHSNVVYLGYLRGYSNMHEATNDYLISNIVHKVALEVVDALGKEYDINTENIIEQVSKFILIPKMASLVIL